MVYKEIEKIINDKNILIYIHLYKKNIIDSISYLI